MRDMFALARGKTLVLSHGKLERGKAWITGYYCKMQETTYAFQEDYERHPVKTHHCIAVDEMTDWGLPNKLRLYEIDPDTAGLYTGKSDRNATRIFEGDILKVGETKETVSVWWDENHDSFVCRGGEVSPVQLGDVAYRSQVIGNIFDNSELLEDK